MMGSSECHVSRTQKDSAQNTKKTTVLELVKRSDGNFDLFVNSALHRGDIDERWLPEELCVRFGFSGIEYDAMLLEANESGRSKVVC
jgi:hypothetical protein